MLPFCFVRLAAGAPVKRKGSITVEFAAWKGFKGGHWQQEIDLRDFIQQNYTPIWG